MLLNIYCNYSILTSWKINDDNVQINARNRAAEMPLNITAG